MKRITNGLALVTSVPRRLGSLGLGVFAVALALHSPIAAGGVDRGRLESFQEGLRADLAPARAARDQARRDQRRKDDGPRRVEHSLAADLMVGGLYGIGYIFLHGGYQSLALVQEDVYFDSPFRADMRLPGDPIIPFASVDVHHQFSSGSLNAWDSRGKVGYGPLAASVRWTQYRETDFAARLDFVQTYGHYRMTVHDVFEFSPGLGYGWFLGDVDASGTAFTAPVRLMLPMGFSAEYRPAWISVGSAGTVYDQDVSLLYGRRYAYARIGYRWVWNRTETLDGPYVGFSLRW